MNSSAKMATTATAVTARTKRRRLPRRPLLARDPFLGKAKVTKATSPAAAINARPKQLFGSTHGDYFHSQEEVAGVDLNRELRTRGCIDVCM